MPGDPKLAALMKSLADRGLIKAPLERILRTDILATAFNRDKLKGLNRIADLECGHKTVTPNRKHAQCQECLRMMLDGEDYQLYRVNQPNPPTAVLAASPGYKGKTDPTEEDQP
jgi:hypothetical protein